MISVNIDIWLFIAIAAIIFMNVVTINVLIWRVNDMENTLKSLTEKFVDK